LSPHAAILVPFVVVASAGVIVWISTKADGPTGSRTQAKACSSCGATVLDDWRLCPDCGRFIERSEALGGVASRPAGRGSDSELTC
jgi:hypothetical protein